jgi:hypothetical protein
MGDGAPTAPSDWIQRFFPAAAPVLNMFLGMTRAELPGGGSAFVGPGPFIQRDTTYNDLSNFLSNIKNGRYTQPWQKALVQQHQELARRIAISWGYTPHDAATASWSLSAPAVAAWAASRVMGTHQLTYELASGLRSSGSNVPYISNSPKDRALQQGLGQISGLAFNNYADFRRLPALQGMFPVEAVRLFKDAVSQGQFNDILSKPDMITGDGRLTSAGIAAVNMRLQALPRMGAAVRQLFGSPQESMQQAMSRAESVLGQSPFTAFGGIDNAGKVLENFRQRLSITGVAPGEAAQLLAGVRQSNPDAHPAMVLGVVSTALDALHRSRGGTAEFINPAQYNQSVLQMVSKSMSPNAEGHPNYFTAIAGAYGRLRDVYGQPKAQQILDGILSHDDDQGVRFGHSSTFSLVQRVNNYLPEDQPLTPEVARAYANDPQVLKEIPYGRIGTAAFNANLNQMENDRVSKLTRDAGLSIEDIGRLRELGGGSVTVDSIRNWVQERGDLAGDPVGQQYERNRLVSKLTGKGGLSAALAQDRLQSARGKMLSNIDQTNRMVAGQNLLNQGDYNVNPIAGAVHGFMTKPDAELQDHWASVLGGAFKSKTIPVGTVTAIAGSEARRDLQQLRQQPAGSVSPLSQVAAGVVQSLPAFAIKTVGDMVLPDTNPPRIN